MSAQFKSVFILTANRASAASVTSVFSSIGSNPVVEVQDKSDEALKVFLSKKPSILFVDWELLSIEEMTKFLQQFRKTGGCRSLPLVITGEKMTAQMVAVASEYGASRILDNATFQDTLASVLKNIAADLVKPTLLRSYGLKLDTAFEKNSLGEIDRVVEEFYTLMPKETRARIEYANLCIRRGYWKQAREIAEKLLVEQPDNIRATNLMARIMMNSGEADKIIALLSKIEILSPQNLERLVLIGKAYGQNGDNEQARLHFEQALDVDPESKEAKAGVGQIELSEGNINQALELFRESASEEETVGFFNNTAVLAVRNKNYEQAVNLYQIAQNVIKKKELKVKVTYNLSLAFLKWKKPELAQKYAEEVLALDPKFEKAKLLVESLKTMVSPVEYVKPLDEHEVTSLKSLQVQFQRADTPKIQELDEDLIEGSMEDVETFTQTSKTPSGTLFLTHDPAAKKAPSLDHDEEF